MTCLDCGGLSHGIRCKDCRARHTQTSRWVYDNTKVELTGGYWYNDNGIMRWRHT